MKPKKIISSPFGGLGDALLLSTLPRRFHEAGFEVLYHNGPMTQWRNTDVKALIMANPYIEGETDAPPNAGHGMYVDLWGRYCWETRLRPANPIGIMEEVNGLPAPYSRCPEVYLKTPPSDKRDDLILIDPYSSSVPFTQDSVGPWIEYYAQHYVGKSWHVLETPGYAAFHRAMFGAPKIAVGSLSEYLALLRSCHAFFGVESGGQMLAAAVKKERPSLKVHALFSTRGFNQRFFVLPNDFVQYDVTCFAIQNDFAVDPAQLGWQHLEKTRTFAAERLAMEAAFKDNGHATVSAPM